VTTVASEARTGLRTRAAARILLGASALAAVWFIWTAPHHAAQLATAIAEVREVKLPDGSRLTLGAKTKVGLQFNRDIRKLKLIQGEAFFAVQHESRPFVVEVEDLLVYALGTQFEVHMANDQVRVAVLDGTVEVSPSARPEPVTGTPRPVTALHRGAEDELQPRIIMLMSHQQLTVGPSGRIGTPYTIGSIEPGAWRSGRRAYVDAPLREIVTDANRYSPRPIYIADRALAESLMSLTFTADNLQQWLNDLSLHAPIDVQYRETGEVILRSRCSRTNPSCASTPSRRSADRIAPASRQARHSPRT
jgi:transmembrane sensor